MNDTHARARVWTLYLAALVLAALTGPLVTLLTPLAHASSTALHVMAAVLAALGVGMGAHVTPATFQLKADGVFVSVRGRDLIDITTAFDVLPARLRAWTRAGRNVGSSTPRVPGVSTPSAWRAAPHGSVVC